MTANPHNPNPSASAEETLRLVVNLPAPVGLEGRVNSALRDLSRRHANGSESGPSGRVLAWPAVVKPQSNWVRTAAAAAIVFVVAGGGWGVYTRVQQNHPGKVIVMPPRVVEPGGFSGAGAIRTPQTLPGPVVKHPVEPKSAKSKPATKPAAPTVGATKNAAAN
jgi:hypothetical protein